LNKTVIVIIPAYNEEDSIEKVIAEIPAHLVNEIIVVNNNSTDTTEFRATKAGATVLLETEQGYGAACLKGMAYVAEKAVQPDIIVFIDGDYSDYPEQMPELLRPIIEQNAELVIGSRALGRRAKGSMTPQQIFGNWLATHLIRWFYKAHFTDLGPFRAIQYASLLRLQMKDRNYGWTVEMQLKAAKQKMKVAEVAVNYRKRIGISKVSGTIRGTVGAGYKIITTIFKYL
jgi:glycosyltransferase involved in cell wall biosynthesis